MQRRVAQLIQADFCGGEHTAVGDVQEHGTCEVNVMASVVATLDHDVSEFVWQLN